MAKYPKKNGSVEAPPKIDWFQKWNLIRPDFNPESFKSEAEREAAWRAHREEVMAEHRTEGKRPEAYWRYDMAHIDLNQYEDQFDALIALGLATDKEIAIYEGRDMPDDEKEEAEFFLSNEGHRRAFPEYTWKPNVEKYKRIFGDK